SIDGRRARRDAPRRPVARRRANPAPGFSPEAEATRPQAWTRSGGKTARPSWNALALRLGLPFVVVAHEAIEQTHTIARAPGLVDLRRGRAHRGASDVEMRPGGLTDEALEELRGGDRAGMAATNVLHVGV